MYTSHSKQVKNQNFSIDYSQRSLDKRRDKNSLNNVLVHGTEPRVPTHEGKTHNCPKGPARRKTPWIKLGLPGEAIC